MSDSEIKLLDRVDGDEETGEGWLPELSLLHSGRNELHIIVGEEAEGMAEGVSVENFERLRRQFESWRDDSLSIQNYLRGDLTRVEAIGTEQVEVGDEIWAPDDGAWLKVHRRARGWQWLFVHSADGTQVKFAEGKPLLRRVA